MAWRSGAVRLVGVAGMLVVWMGAASLLPDTVLPGPSAVLQTIWRNLHQPETFYHIGVTVRRVLVGMGLALVAGTLVGVIMGISRVGEWVLDTWVLVGLTIPAVVYGIVCILWFGLRDLAAFMAIGISAFPAIAINMWQGVKAIDLSLVHMGKAFRLSRRALVLKVVIPQTVPYLLAAVRYALGISWKIATVVELIGLSSGVGYMLHYWYGLFSMRQVLAWTLTFTGVLVLFEFVVLKPLDGWVTRWRPRVST
ncbi:MAG: ABC transporter permease [Armatimonadota bacterium]|nr:ABC transporter permease [Armatimonadota bacterium]MDR7444548.1 ABC transporter permease [Armatimonadota bacterium]MDR7570317.1 ABC transporter permease [Armatimonadota bacterium]MDR7615339.1 ABC transporter permease [Armatimonadota bacterium]